MCETAEIKCKPKHCGRQRDGEKIINRQIMNRQIINRHKNNKYKNRAYIIQGDRDTLSHTEAENNGQNWSQRQTWIKQAFSFANSRWPKMARAALSRRAIDGP